MTFYSLIVLRFHPSVSNDLMRAKLKLLLDHKTIKNAQKVALKRLKHLPMIKNMLL